MTEQLLLYIAILLLLIVGVAHSYLGERFILQRLFRKNGLPKLFGDTKFTEYTLRFAWHLTTVAWWGYALLLLGLAHPPLTAQEVAGVTAVVFLLHFIIAIWFSRGRHLSWIPFGGVAAVAAYVAF